ncbi:MAG: InlB B-repeat-containing protein, partial [Candidatus Izemoplasmataceae bacterium]
MLKKMLGFIVIVIGGFTLHGCEEGTDLTDDYDIEIISEVEPFDYDQEVSESGEMTVSLTDYDDSAYAFSHWTDTSDASILSEQETFTFTLEDRDYEIEAVFEPLEDNSDDEQGSGDEDEDDDETGNDEESDEPEEVYSTAFESADVGFWSDYDTYAFDGVDWLMNNTSNTVYEDQDRYNGDASIRIDDEADSFIEMTDGF